MSIRPLTPSRHQVGSWYPVIPVKVVPSSVGGDTILALQLFQVLPLGRRQPGP